MQQHSTTYVQAMDRAHRIGQKKEVHVYRFCTDSSIEEKVIEKAYKKLRLDALVIQQGRLTENTKTVNKEDLLNMVRYGAEKIFNSAEHTAITDHDIDMLIAKGEQATKELNDKMKEFSENAMRFTMDGGVNLYEYKDEDKEEEGLDLKMIIGHNWVDPPKRERKRLVNYSETEFRVGAWHTVCCMFACLFNSVHRLHLLFSKGKAREGGARNQGPRLPNAAAARLSVLQHRAADAAVRKGGGVRIAQAPKGAGSQGRGGD